TRAPFTGVIENNRGERTFALPDGPLSGFEAQISADWRGIAFVRKGFYLCANPALTTLEHNRTGVQAWETFMWLSRADLDDLKFVLDHDWVVKSTGKVVRAGESGL